MNLGRIQTPKGYESPNNHEDQSIRVNMIDEMEVIDAAEEEGVEIPVDAEAIIDTKIGVEEETEVDDQTIKINTNSVKVRESTSVRLS